MIENDVCGWVLKYFAKGIYIFDIYFASLLLLILELIYLIGAGANLLNITYTQGSTLRIFLHPQCGITQCIFFINN